jgi:hypothetical protein
MIVRACMEKTTISLPVCPPIPQVRENVAYHMAYAHQCVTEAGVRFVEAFRRYTYTTPKSYLELISLYKSLLDVSTTASWHPLPNLCLW